MKDKYKFAEKNDNVLVYGPAACGKTSHAEALKQAFGMKQILDEGSWERLPLRNIKDTLLLTHKKPEGNAVFELIKLNWLVIPYKDAMKKVTCYD